MDYSSVHVLVVEDKEIYSSEIAEILKDMNAKCDIVKTGEDAVETIAAASNGDYNLILIDVKLPGMSGYETACKLRSHPEYAKATIPMLALVEDESSYAADYALGHGFCNRMLLPVEETELRRLTRNCMNLYQDMYDDPILMEFKTLYEAKGIKVGYFVYETERPERMLFVDDDVVEMMGCSSFPEFMEYIDGSFSGFVYQKDIHRLHESIDNQFYGARDGYDQVNYRILRKDGAIRKVVDIARRTSSDGPEDLFYVYVADVTDL